MINTKRPSTDDYTQVDFVEAKDTQGNYRNIDHIYDSQGNIVFQQGYLNEYQGADNFSIPTIGKSLIDYTIYGNTVQNAAPTHDNPIMPQGTGDRTGNLVFVSVNNVTYYSNYNQYTISDGTITVTGRMLIGFKVKVTPDTTYTVSAVLKKRSVLMRIREYTEIPNDWLNGFIDQPVNTDLTSATFTTASEAEWILVTFYSEAVGATVNNIMLNLSSEALPYEPYGIKIPISSGGKNLFDESNFALVQVTSTAYRYGTSLGVLSQGTYTFNAVKSAGAQSIYLTAKLNGVYSQTTISSVPFSFTADGNSEYIIRTANNTGTTWEAEKYSDMMLNLGSTPHPYEPYNRTTTPVYLGEVETTRRIRKLVLDGTENWVETAGVYFDIIVGDVVAWSECYCTHCKFGDIIGNNTGIRLWVKKAAFTEYSTVADFKSYLAAQYANGTPVTVWYVLATEETGVVNEPLMKIGDYADTLSMEQAGASIPTLNKPNTTVIDVETEVEPSEVDVTYRGSTKPKYGLFLAQNGDSFEAKDGQSLYIGGDL